MRRADMQEAPGSPLREALDLVDPEKYYFDLGLGVSGDGWRLAASLAWDGGEFLAEQMARSTAKWGTDKRGAATSLVGSYAWRVGGPAIACYVLSRRVPDVSPGNVAVRFDEDGGLSGAALVRESFAVLPSDPAAERRPGATVLADEARMLAWLRQRLEAGIEPLVARIRERTRVGARTMWGTAADTLAQAFLMVGKDAPGSSRQARYGADAEAFVKAPGSPLRGKTGFFVVERGGRSETFMTRAVCCRAYLGPEHGNCDSCPMLPREERERRATESMAPGREGRA